MQSLITRLALTGLATAGLVVACQHEVPGPIVAPVPREARPLGPRPDIIRPGGGTVPVPARRDGSVSITPGPISALARLGAIPAAADTMDAGVADGGVPLLPVPDAAILRDGEIPMR